MMERTFCASTQNTVGSYTSSSSSSCGTSTPLVCFHYFTQQLCELAALSGAISGDTPTTSSRSNSPCDQITITEEPATISSSSRTTYCNRHKRRGKDGFNYNNNDKTHTTAAAATTPASIATTTARHPSYGQQSSYNNNTQTATPKRRRKENGVGSARVRYSPDKQAYSPCKKSHLRDSISQSGSLLDYNKSANTTRSSSSRNTGTVGTSRSSNQQELAGWEAAAAATHTDTTTNSSSAHYWMEEDEQSQLVGLSIPLPQSPASTSNSPPLSSLAMHMNQDDLSYSDSEVSPPNVIKDLTQELLWEKLMEVDDEEEMGKSYCGESYESLEQVGLLSSPVPGTTSPIPLLHPLRKSPHLATAAEAPIATKRTLQTDLFEQGFLMSPPKQSIASIVTNVPFTAPLCSSPHSLAMSTSPTTIMEYTSTCTNSLVGEVISVMGPDDEDEADRPQTLEQQKQQEQYALSSSSLLPSPRKFDLDCRQVSECSELTMDFNNPTTTTRGMVHLNHNISTDDEDEGVLQVTTNIEASDSTDSSRECLSSEDEERYDSITLSSGEGRRSSSNYTSSSSSSSTPTCDNMGGENDRIRNEEEQYYCDNDKYQDLPSHGSGKRFRRRSSRHAIGFATENILLHPAQTSPSKRSQSRHATDHWTRNKDPSFLFPMRNMADDSFLVTDVKSFTYNSKGGPRKKGASNRRQRTGEPKQCERKSRGCVINKNEKEPNILVDLSKDIKDVAIMAGKSSGKVVTNLFHHLYEETTNNKWTYL